jgi:EpsI family protein
MIPRALVIIVLLAGSAVFGARAVATERAVAREPLAALPLQIDDWRGRDGRPLADDVVAQLGVDDYVHRTYVSGAGAAVSLYAGYYQSQRQGDTIHSPQNCLPGAGWRPTSSTVVAIPAAGRAAEVNQYMIQKGMERQVVLYWYQGRGRVVANEYWNKAFLMWDAAVLHRTNGGLVRIMAPVSTARDGISDARIFAAALLPRLASVMP